MHSDSVFFCCFPLSIYGDFSLILSYTVPISICELPLCFSLALVWFCRLGAHVHLPITMLSASLKPTKLLGHVPVLFPNSSVSWVSICGFGRGVSVGWVAIHVERSWKVLFFNLCPCLLSLTWGQRSVFAQCEVHFRALASGWALPLAMIESGTFLC